MKMDDNHRKVLQKHTPELISDLDITSEIIGNFIHYGLFTEDHIDVFMSEKTRRAKVQKMLEILPRRGPQAFNKFVRSIQNAYQWIADKMRQDAHKHTSLQDSELKLTEKVDIYVDEEFGHNARFSQADKRNIRNFLRRVLRENSRHDTMDSVDGQIKTAAENKEEKTKEVEEILLKLNDLLDGNKGLKTAPCSNPPEISFETIESKINILNGKVRDLEEEMKECYAILGKEQSDAKLSEILKDQNAIKVSDIHKLESKIEELQKESKLLEEELHTAECQLEDQLEQNKNILKDKENLAERCKQLELMEFQHAQKQQTLLTMQSLVKQTKQILSPNKDFSEDPFIHKTCSKQDEQVIKVTNEHLHTHKPRQPLHSVRLPRLQNSSVPKKKVRTRCRSETCARSLMVKLHQTVGRSISGPGTLTYCEKCNRHHEYVH